MGNDPFLMLENNLGVSLLKRMLPK